jgi:hypothetical protein
MHLFNCSI